MRSILRGAPLLAFLVSALSAWGSEPAPTFYRGVNLNGPPLVIDGQAWEGNDARHFRCNGKAFENPDVPLIPPTDAERAKMIHSSRWGNGIDVELTDVPPNEYHLFLYVWEDNQSTTFSVSVNGRRVLERYSSGAAGAWKKLGPWRTKPSDGVLKVSASGGDANLSGLEVWQGEGDFPAPLRPEFNLKPNADEIAFFESKIRPILVDRCSECHSQESPKVGGNLLLDSRAGLMHGGDSGPCVIPGEPGASLLLKAVRKSDPDLKMPPEDQLDDLEIADLERWIAMRAPDPRDEDTLRAFQARTAIDWDKARDFWSLRPLASPQPPAVKNEAWPSNEIDRFILAKQEAAGLPPAEDAPPPVWLRRVTYDLIGLPPTPEEIADFTADHSPDAYARVVDRLLASPQYGERWGRHWLDVVRYSDTAGDNSDFPVPQMYLYRNWVVDAVNRDLPYDDFVRQQLAGDLMSGGTDEETRQRTIATGYIANSRRFGSRVDDYPWHLTIEDTLDNVGRAFLATTINCARCHNHKFDPVTNEDYYALYGIFHSTRYPWPGIELEQRQRDLVAFAPREEVERILNQRNRRRDELQSHVKRLTVESKQKEGDEKKEAEKRLEEAKKRVKAFDQEPLPYEQAYAVADAATIEDAAVQLKGDPTKPGKVVERRFLSVFGGLRLSPDDKTSGRLQLAEWIVDPKNPLTPRVVVNRIWLHHFGRGLVSTPNDFGRQGKPPSHPELLDYLASRFISGGWKMKPLHRELVLSRTYRQSSVRTPRAVDVDPSNELLSSFPRLRLDAEEIRDALLFVSGRLDESRGDAHPFPPQSEWAFTQHNPFKAIYDTNRRSLYLMTQRIQRHPYLAIFDGADPSISVGQRLTSTTPLQALYLLNDAFVHEQAAALAQRTAGDARDEKQRLSEIYLRLFGRPPTQADEEAAVSFLAAVSAKLREAQTPENEIARQSWEALTRALLRLNEFVYLD